MKSEKDVLRKLANEIANRIIRKTISALQQVTDTLSGDDSELINAWDEICVQVQHEHSFYWDVYDETARSFIRAYVEELKDYEELALWFQTDHGWDWHYSDEEERNECPPIFVEDIVQFVAQKLYGKAGDWSNERIREYLDRSYLD
jgi:hypothetical protein